MPRPERPLDGLSGPIAQFAADLRELRRRAGSPPYRRLAKSVHYGTATLAEAASGHRLPTLSVTLAYVRACGGDVDQWTERWHTVARDLDLDTAEAAVSGTGPWAISSQAPQDDIPCPYPGLAAFATSEAAWFFGRERLTAELMGRLAECARGTGPLLVVGPSGAGKSSLLRAGLLPALARGALPAPGARDWPVLLFTPTAHPVHELAARLGELAGRDLEAIADQVIADPVQFTDVLREVLGQALGAAKTATVRAVLVVDQFEETFALCADEVEREAFVAALCAATRPGSPEDGRRGEPAALVVLGLRADFYGYCAAFPELVEALQAGQIIVGPMTVPELRAAITKPADATGLELQPGLTEVLLRDVGADPEPPQRSGATRYDPGALPLLSHALRATWQQREGHTLTVNGYHLTGEISGAVATTAERTYRRLDTATQRLARLLLLRLVQVGDGTDDSRRRIDRAQLQHEFLDRTAATAALEAFAQARLVTLDAGTVEITHDALLRHWPRLKEWIDTDRAGLLVHQHLIEAADTWDGEHRDSSALYRGARLAAVRAWVNAGHRSELAGLVAEFLDTSIHHEHIEQHAARRRTRLLYQLLTAVTVLLVAAASLAGYALQQRAVANDQRLSAVSRQVAGEADRLRRNDVPLAMQLSLAAYQISPTTEARSALLSSSAMIPATRVLGPTEVVQSVAYSPDQRTLAVGSGDHIIRLWDVTVPGKPSELAILTAPTSYVFSVAFSPDGHTLAAGSGDHTVRLWDVTTPRHPIPLGQPLTGAATVYSVAFSPDGHSLAIGSADHTVQLWDVSQPARPHRRATLTGPADYVYSVAFSPDGHTLAAGSADTTVRLWDVTTPRHPIPLGRPLTGGTKTIYTVAFSPDGRTLAVGSADGSVRRWNITSRARPIPLGEPLTGPTSSVYSVAFSGDGSTLAVGSADGSVRLWNVTTGRTTAILPHPGPVTTVAFGYGDHTLATGSADGVVRLWALPGPVLTGPTRGVTAVAFSPDGRSLAAGSVDTKVWRWDIANLTQPHVLPSLTGPTNDVYTVAFSPDGHTLAAGSVDDTVRLWNVTNPAVPVPLGRPLTGPTGPVESVVFSPGGRTLAAGSNDKKVWRWDVTNPAQPRPLPSLTGPTNFVYSVAFSPDGHTLAAGSVDDTVRLWNVTNPVRPISLGPPLTGPTNYVESVVFSPDGHTLAVGSADHTLRLWNVTNPARPIALGGPLTGPNGTVYTAVFSADGHTLATGNLDNTVWLWDLTNPKQPRALATLTGPADVVYGVAFSPDGHSLAAGSADNTVRLFNIEPNHVASYICSIAGDLITRSEWNRYIPDLPYNAPCAQRR